MGWQYSDCEASTGLSVPQPSADRRGDVGPGTSVSNVCFTFYSLFYCKIF